MVDHRPGIGVFKEIEELLLHVAIIDIEGDTARLEGTEHPLKVFIAIVEIERDMVLSGLPALEAGSLSATAQVVRPQYIRKPPRAIGHLGPTETAVPEDNALAFRNDFGNGFVNQGEVHHVEGTPEVGPRRAKSLVFPGSTQCRVT